MKTLEQFSRTYSSADESVDNATSKCINDRISSSKKVISLFAMVAKTILLHSDVEKSRGLHGKLK